MLTLSKNFFTSFASISRLAKKKKKTKKKFVEIVVICRALLDYNLCIIKCGIKEAAVPNIPSR